MPRTQVHVVQCHHEWCVAVSEKNAQVTEVRQPTVDRLVETATFRREPEPSSGNSDDLLIREDNVFGTAAGSIFSG